MSRYTPAELQLLAGAEFNRILADDQELRRLESLKYDKNAETRLLLEVMNLGDFRIGKLPVRPLTAAKWAFLWMLDNRYATGGAIRTIDLDVALYILSAPDLRELRLAPWEIPGAAAGYAAATGLEAADVHREVAAWRDAAFRPLELMPPADLADEPPRYDAEWLTRICGVAVRETGESWERVMHGMSLSTVCCAYVNFVRRESTEPHRFRRRPDAELEAQITARINELAREFLSDRSDRSDQSDEH